MRRDHSAYLELFAKPPSERANLLNCIHWVTPGSNPNPSPTPSPSPNPNQVTPQDTTTSAEDPIAGMTQ